MRIAQVASMRSNCIKRKVGAVVVIDRRIVSTGYNGTPRGTRNCNEGGCPRCSGLAASGT
ncbi:MAG: cytidine deaminase, partial [Acidobacteria bacterium]|nr:cytidine deaminase [Acidobacteriota bacterium]